MDVTSRKLVFLTLDKIEKEVLDFKIRSYLSIIRNVIEMDTEVWQKRNNERSEIMKKNWSKGTQKKEIKDERNK